MDHNHSFPQPPPNQTESQTESDRLLGIAEKLLQNRDLTGSREFALLAQETESLSEGSDQILAITDVLLASETRVNINNNRVCNWYSILQIEPRSEPDLIRKSYRRLALLLHPDKNKYPLADTAFKLVADAWGVLSDPTKRTPYDHGLGYGAKPRPPNQQQDKLPVRRSGVGVGSTPTPSPTNNSSGGMNNSHSRAVGGGSTGTGSSVNFWTTCPYCYVLYQYPKVYKECCMRCQNCERAFHAAVIPSLPPLVPGKEAYYCCWGFFPLGFSIGDSKGKKANGNVGDSDNDTETINANVNVNANASNNSGFPNWMPGMFATAPTPTPNVGVRGVVDFSDGSGSGFGNASGSKKRGRPRKNPMGF